jgi:hypothetical protein
MSSWVRMTDNRLVNQNSIEECQVMQVLPEYGWWVKCIPRNKSKSEYWIHSGWDKKDEAIKALESLYKK